MQIETILSQDDFMLLRDLITAEVSAVRRGESASANLIDRLRTYERTAHAIGLEPQTAQVISSGRRLLGDRLDLEPKRKHRPMNGELRQRRPPLEAKPQAVTLAPVG